MLCAISGEAPQVPVVSSKSGNVFEKRLIEEYISENGKDPVTGEALTTEDLIDIKSNRIVRPRPPTLTSIPSLLSTFQNEWDALALETYTLRQQLAQTRQELSTALYQHDAAVRVIARLLQERDEARDALSKITASGVSQAANGDAMQVDSNTVPEHIQEKITNTHAQLSAGRRKRPVPAEWATEQDLGAFKVSATSEASYVDAKGISLDASASRALISGPGESLSVYSISEQKPLRTFSVEQGQVTSGVWAGARPVVATSAGVVQIWDEEGSKSDSLSAHAGAVRSLSLHPSGSLLGSVGVDKSYALHDLEASKTVAQVYTDSSLTCSHFHPDGNLFGAGARDSKIHIFDARENKIAATFESTSGPVKSLSFSENGFWLAAAHKDDNSVVLWDLRKAQVVKNLEIGSAVDHISWDYTGQFLASAGPQGITVQQYSKASKSWSEPFRAAVPSVAVAWGANAKSLVSLSREGTVTTLAPA